MDVDAREAWFYQAIGSSPAMFRRDAGAGSLYWLGLRERTGAYVEGGRTYELTVPLPVPGKLFWLVTVYDNESRSEIITNQGKAALRSLFRAQGQDRLISGPLLRSQGATRTREPMDQDDPRQGMVRLLPHLRPRSTRIRRLVEAGGLRKDQVASSVTAVCIGGRLISLRSKGHRIGFSIPSRMIGRRCSPIIKRGDQLILLKNVGTL